MSKQSDADQKLFVDYERRLRIHLPDGAIKLPNRIGLLVIVLSVTGGLIVGALLAWRFGW